MKIGILTLPLCTNYGGILQAYALQTVLEKMGHEVWVIDKKTDVPSLPLWKAIFVYPKRFVNKILGNKDNIVFLEKYVVKTQSIVRKNTDRFIKEYIHRIVVDSYSELSSDNSFDAIIVGSDQVWRPVYFGENRIEDAYLNFAKNLTLKRITYAPSFGVDVWEYSAEQTAKCKALLQKFNMVSVREKSGLQLCHKYLNCEAQWVLDPTMLLDDISYIHLFEKDKSLEQRGGLLNYILDDTPEKNAIIQKVSVSKKILPFRVGSKTENIHASIDERIQPPLEDWLRGFYDAEFIVTDSFHACVFSILFKKQFVVAENKQRGVSRIKSLLECLDIEDRIVDQNFDIDSMPVIDYESVYKRLNKMRTFSYEFIKKAVS